MGSTTKDSSAGSVHWLAVTCTSENWWIPITEHLDCSRWMVMCKAKMYWSLLLQRELWRLVFGGLLAAFARYYQSES